MAKKIAKQSEIVESIIKTAMQNCGFNDKKCIDNLDIKVVSQEVIKIMVKKNYFIVR